MSLAVATYNDVDALVALVDNDYWNHLGMDGVVVDMDSFPYDAASHMVPLLVAEVEEEGIGDDSLMFLTC